MRRARFDWFCLISLRICFAADADSVGGGKLVRRRVGSDCSLFADLDYRDCRDGFSDLYARSTAVLKTGHCPYCDKWIIEDRSLVNKIDPAAILENGIAKKYLVLYRAAVASYISILLFAPMYLSALIAGHQSYWMRTAMVWARKFGAERGRERVFLFIVFWCVIEIVVTQVIVHYRKKAPAWLPQMFAGIAMDWGINDPNAGETPATRVKLSWVTGVVWIIWGISLFILAAMKLMIEGLFPR